MVTQRCQQGHIKKTDRLESNGHNRSLPAQSYSPDHRHYCSSDGGEGQTALSPPLTNLNEPLFEQQPTTRVRRLLKVHRPWLPRLLQRTVTEFRQPLQVQSHLEMPRILVQRGHTQRT